MRRIFSSTRAFAAVVASVPAAATASHNGLLSSSNALMSSAIITTTTTPMRFYSGEGDFTAASSSSHDNEGSGRFLRDCNPASVLKTVRQNPGMTTSYYARRYFGEEQKAVLNHILWSDLKRFGKVYMKRSASPSSATLTQNDITASSSAADASAATADEVYWYPMQAYKGRPIRINRHRPEDEDLSLLKDFVPQVPEFLIKDPPKPPTIPTIGGGTSTKQEE